MNSLQLKLKRNYQKLIKSVKYLNKKMGKSGKIHKKGFKNK